MDPGIHVVAEVALALEMAIAFLAVMVIGTLCVVLLPRILARKVAIAVIAWPVGIGITFVLLESAVVWEGTCTATAIRHRMVVVRREEGEKPWKLDLLNLCKSHHSRGLHV